MAKFYDNLKKLFSTSVIVRNVGGKNFKVVDTARYQSDGSPFNTKVIDRFGRLHGSKAHTTNTWNQYYAYSSTKIDLYTDYEAMDEDPLISSALDIYADESTTKNEEGEVLVIKAQNAEVQKILHNLFYDILNIEYNLWPWTRNMCKYGDYYMFMDIKENVGIVNVTPLSSYETLREEGTSTDDMYRTRFVYEGPLGKGTFENFEIAHFRLLSDTNFLPYGKSILEGARKIYKQLVLMEDAMLTHRVMRAPEKRLFKIDIGNIPPSEVDQYMQSLINSMKKIPLIDPQTGNYNLRYNMQNILEDFFLPVRGKDSGTTIETLAGLQYQAIDDVKYLQQKLFAALKIPRAFLGYDENVEGKATLAAEDIRFSRTIERVQRILVSELTKMAIVHLYAQGFRDSELIEFKLELTSPSIIYEQEKINLLQKKVELFTAATETHALSKLYMYKNIFNFSEDEAKQEVANMIEDAKYKFRVSQLESEGNDPTVTAQSFGTPHDVASSNTAQQAEPMGRPKELGSNYGTDSHYAGRDPIGQKAGSDIRPDFKVSHKYKGGSPLSTESSGFESYLNTHFKVKTKQIIADSLKPATTHSFVNEDVKIENDTDTFLDEKNIIST